MAYNEALASRIRRILSRRKGFTEKKMFGGLAFMLHENLCVGVWKDSLIARVGPENREASMREPGVGEFDVTGKPMKGWIMVHSPTIDEDDNLREWVQLAITFVRALPAK